MCGVRAAHLGTGTGPSTEDTGIGAVSALECVGWMERWKGIPVTQAGMEGGLQGGVLADNGSADGKQERHMISNS